MGSTPNEIVVTVRLHMDYKHLYDCHMDYIYHVHIDLSSLIKPLRNQWLYTDYEYIINIYKPHIVGSSPYQSSIWGYPHDYGNLYMFPSYAQHTSLISPMWLAYTPFICLESMLCEIPTKSSAGIHLDKPSDLGLKITTGGLRYPCL